MIEPTPTMPEAPNLTLTFRAAGQVLPADFETSGSAPWHRIHLRFGKSSWTNIFHYCPASGRLYSEAADILQAYFLVFRCLPSIRGGPCQD